ncbi:SH3 domain-containing protein [Streptomyces sp. NPDC020607]|uniref:SH3 domain-containing protein n=1 Tax=Streptomyces sp. NPDC020607 TaxID=3365082 RepID=UPI0037AAABFB
MHLSKRLGFAVAATTALLVTLTPASASAGAPATASAQQSVGTVTSQAAACGVTPRNRDTSPYAQHFKSDVYLRNGPAWGCGIVDTAKVTNKVDYWCSTDGFTYVRTASTKYGWVYNGYLKDGGSSVPC